MTLLTEEAKNDPALALEEHLALMSALGKIMSVEMRVIREDRWRREYLRMAAEKEGQSA